MKPLFSKSRIALALSAGCFALHSVAQATTYYWDNNTTTAGFGTAGGTWTAPTVSQWSTDLTGVAAPGASITTTTSDVLNFGTASDGLAAGTITVSGTVNANSLTYGSASGAILLSGGTINLGGTTPTITVNNTTNTISSGITGSAGLTKAGTGALMIQVGSAYTGATTINGGKLQINNATGTLAWTPGLININNGSTLEFTGVGQTIVDGASDNITFGSGGGGSIVMTKNTIWRNASIITTGGAKNTVSGTYFNGQNTYRVIYGVAVGTDLGGIDLEVSSTHTNVGGITKDGNGTLALTNNTNVMVAAATIIINAGTVEIGGAGRLQSGLYAGAITNNGTFKYNSSATQTLSGVISGNGALVKSNASTLTLSGANTYTGATTLNQGTLQLNGSTHASSAVGIGTAGILSGNGTVNGSATLTGGGIINKSAGTIAGTLAVTGGNWNGAGTVTGAVTSSSGTFTIGNGANLTSTAGASATGGALVVNGTLTGTLSANSSTTVSGSGTITGNTTISGIHSPGNSPGIQSYGSNLSYTSGSSVTWELGVNALGLRGTDFDGINVGGALDFSGATAVNLAFNFAGSSVDWTNAFWDTSRTGTAGWLVYDVAGTTTNFANLSVNTINWFDDSGASFDTYNSGNTFSLYQDGNDIYLNYTVVPEPNVAALLGGLGTLLLLRRRR